MTTSADEGVYSIYTAQPSETNCSINEALSSQMNAINEFTHELSVSQYSEQPSEVDVSMRDGFESAALFDLTEYSIPPSETNVTMADEVDDVSVCSQAPSETNVSMSDGFEPCKDLRRVYESDYSGVESEANVSMSDGFDKCPVMSKIEQLNRFDYDDEVTAVDEDFQQNEEELHNLAQEQLGIADENMFVMQLSNGKMVKVVDSVECLKRLDEFELVPVDFENVKNDSTMITLGTMNDNSSFAEFLKSSH